MKINPILSDTLIRLDRQFIEDIAVLKEKFSAFNATRSSGYGLAISKRYIEEIEKIAKYIFEDSHENFHEIFSSMYTKELKKKLVSDLDGIQGTYQVDEAYQRLLKRYNYERGFL